MAKLIGGSSAEVYEVYFVRHFGITLQVLRELLFTKYGNSTKKQYIQSVVSEMHKNIFKSLRVKW